MFVLCVYAVEVYAAIQHDAILFLTSVKVIQSLTPLPGNSCGRMEEVEISGKASMTY